MQSRIEVKIPGFAHSCFKSRHFPNRFALHFVLDPRVVNRWEFFILSCLHWGWQPGEFPEKWTEVAFSKQIWRNICLRTNVCLRSCFRDIAGPCPFASSVPLCITKIKTNTTTKTKNKVLKQDQNLEVTLLLTGCVTLSKLLNFSVCKMGVIIVPASGAWLRYYL